MVYTVGDTLSLISHTFTLRPGDLLATGTPAGVGYGRTPPWLLQPGDVVEVEVERIGVAAQHRRRQLRAEGLTMSGEYRQYLFPHDHPRVAEVRGMDPYTYGEFSRKPGTFTGGLVEGWTPLYRNEFRGVTEDGILREGLYPFEPAAAGRGGAGRGHGRRRATTCSPPWTTTAASGSPSTSTPSSGRPGPTRSSCSSTPACGWTCSRSRCARRRSP